MISKSVFIKKKRIMEKFNLEEYLKNPARRVVTRDGRNARIISTDMNSKNYPIVALVKLSDNTTEDVWTYTKDGEWDNYESTTYDLFFAPEKDKEQRFNLKTLKPFDKVLGRDYDSVRWKCGLFSHIMDESIFPYICIGNGFIYCIPYNDDTKHLAGTNENAPEYYRYWEE